MDLSIIIVNWNSKDFLIRCLASLFERPPRLSFEVIVIDSGSFDGCGEVLRDKYPAVRFIQWASNVGFARSNNEAFQVADGACLLFLNPDTELSGQAVQALYSVLVAGPRTGIVGARLLNSDGSLQTSCVQSMPNIVNKVLDSNLLRALFPTSPLWGTEALSAGSLEPARVDAVSGACLMIKSSVFRAVSGFSDDYFMYAEDIDLAYKVHRAGYDIYHVPTVEVVHHGGNSSSQAHSTFATVMMSEATVRFFRKTRGRAYASCFRCAMLLNAVGRLALLALAQTFAQDPSGGIQSSRNKWQALLRWSLNRDRLVRRYYPAQTASRT